MSGCVSVCFENMLQNCNLLTMFLFGSVGKRRAITYFGKGSVMPEKGTQT